MSESEIEIKVYADGEVPEHAHSLEWDYECYDADIEIPAGVWCTFSWLTVPSTRGKYLRKRKCDYRLSMDEILQILSQSINQSPTAPTHQD